MKTAFVFAIFLATVASTCAQAQSLGYPFYGRSSEVDSVVNSPQKQAYAAYVINQEFPSVLAAFLKRTQDEALEVHCDSDGLSAEFIASRGHCDFRTAKGRRCESYLDYPGKQYTHPTRWQLSCRDGGTAYFRRSREAITLNQRVFPGRDISYPTTRGTPCTIGIPGALNGGC